MPSSSVTSLTTTNSINTTTPITTKTTSTTQQLKLRQSITKIVVEKSLNGGSTPTSSISNISDSSPGTSNAAIVQVLQNSTDPFPPTQSCGFILSATDPTTTTLIGQQQNNNILTTTLVGQQQNNNNNNILQTTLGKQIVASVIGQSQSTTTASFHTGITTDSPIFDVLQQQERLERNENITKTNELQQNGAERSFPLLQNGVETSENGFVSKNESKLVKNELKVVRDYLSTASTSTTTTPINGIKNETEPTTKRFQNPQLILTKTLLNNGANIRFGPNHVFTSRSFIRAGLDSSLKYQVWAGISFLGRF